MAYTKPLSSDYRLDAANPEQDLLPVSRLTSDIFAGGQYVSEIAQTYIGNCHYDWHTTRLIWHGEKLIHHWGVWGYQMRVESVTLKVAGIGAVATDDAYRKQGLMHHAARASFQAMEQDGYDLSILRGRHYVKMGYARAWNYVTYRLKPEELPASELAPSCQLLGTEHIPEVDDLYNCTHAAFTGTAIRPTYRSRSPEDMGLHAWFDAAGKLAGYVRLLPAEDDPKTLQCLEAAGDPFYGLAVVRELFRNGNYEKLTFFTLPHLHPLLQVLRRGACIVEDRYFDVSGWRVRIINLHTALGKLVPLLEKRLQASQFAGWQGSLLLDAGEQQASLQLRDGRLEVAGALPCEHCVHGAADIARFLIGSAEPDEILRQADMTCTGQAIPLLRVLFPNLHPMMSHWDEY